MNLKYFFKNNQIKCSGVALKGINRLLFYGSHNRKYFFAFIKNKKKKALEARESISNGENKHLTITAARNINKNENIINSTGSVSGKLSSSVVYNDSLNFIKFNKKGIPIIEKNYYDSLGVDVKANSKQIRYNFLTIAKTYHPDKNPDCLVKYAIYYKGILYSYLHRL